MANCGGGDVVIRISPRARQPSGGGQRGHRQEAAWLPLDIIVTEIAARSDDAATLVRCAATCRAARRRVAEDAYLRGLIRLRDTGRFLLPLLRGHLVGTPTYDYVGGRGRVKTNVYLVDTTTADATRVVEATFVSAAAEAEMLMDPVPMDSRGGLVLIGATATAPPLPRHQTLLVCNPATGRHLVLPPEPEPFTDGGGGCIREQYVLLVGDRDDGEGGADAGAAVGRPFQVLKVKLMLSHHNRLLVQTFSSEDGSWSPRTEIPTPLILGCTTICFESLKKVLVVGDVVHWLYLTNVGSYVLMLHVREARVSVTALPATFPRYNTPGICSYLLATDSAGGSLVVLVADTENNIRAWEQCKGTESKMMWKAWPRVMIHKEAIHRFNNEVKETVLQYNYEVANRWTGSKRALELLWFGERSGVVLLRTHGCCLLWLDLYSKKIVRCFCSDHMSYAQVYCPYEMDLSFWAPTFSSAVSI